MSFPQSRRVFNFTEWPYNFVSRLSFPSRHILLCNNEITAKTEESPSYFSLSHRESYSNPFFLPLSTEWDPSIRIEFRLNFNGISGGSLECRDYFRWRRVDRIGQERAWRGVERRGGGEGRSLRGNWDKNEEPLISIFSSFITLLFLTLEQVPPSPSSSCALWCASAGDVSRTSSCAQIWQNG